jgi:5-methylcytosine-specific restriction endonuclease McrA
MSSPDYSLAMALQQRTLFPTAAANCLAALGLPASSSVSDLTDMLLSDSEALMILLDEVTAGRAPNIDNLPDTDRDVQTALDRLFVDRVQEQALRTKKRPSGTQNRLLLAMLLERPGEWVPLIELLLANGLRTDTPRRLRELREEHGGWQIEQAGVGRRSRYRLASTTPDVDASARWWLHNNIRNSGMPPHERILVLLKAHLGEPVPLRAVQYVNPKASGGGRGRTRQAQSETSRRIRELREKGWQVYSALDNAVADLGSSDYIMLTLERLPAYERLKPTVWADVVKRDGRMCQECGWTPGAGPTQGRKCLEVHHRNPQRARPDDVNNVSNLITLCNVCHDSQA